MEINERNKEFYELAFIENGEYGYGFKPWKPSIDERECSDMMGCSDGVYMPATPCGYRDYKTSRLQGIRNILDQYPSVKLDNDKFHHLKREDNTVKMYDKIVIDGGREFVVCGDDEEVYYMVDAENKLFCVSWEKEPALEEEKA
jgi:hypothetical protein